MAVVWEGAFFCSCWERNLRVQSDLTKTLLRLMFAGPEAGGPASMSPPLMQTLLQVLCEVPDAASMAKVLALGIDVGKMPAEVQFFLLATSVQLESMEAVRLLLDHSADPFAESGLVFLVTVRCPWSTAYLPMLLARGPAPKRLTLVAFAEACRRGDMPSVTLLLPTDAESIREHIWIAVQHGFLDALPLLVKQPVSTRANLNTGLDEAVRFGKLQAAELLLKLGAEPYNADGNSLLLLLRVDAPAAAGVRLGMARLLLQHGSRVTNHALDMAKKAGMHDVLEFLQEQEGAVGVVNEVRPLIDICWHDGMVGVVPCVMIPCLC